MFSRVAPMKIMKRYCHAFGTWSSPSATRDNHLNKQGRNFTSLVALNFSPEYDVLLFDFSRA